MDEISRAGAQTMYKNCLNDKDYFNKLNIHEQKAVQKVCCEIIKCRKQSTFDMFRVIPAYIESDNLKKEAIAAGYGETQIYDYLLNKDCLYKQAISVFEYYHADKKHEGRKPKDPKSFEDLFTNKNQAEDILNIFINNDYCDLDNRWIYPGNNKSITTPFYILLTYFDIIEKNTTPQRTQLRIWCNKLGSFPNDSGLKNLLNNPARGKNPTPRFKKEQREFYELFKLSFTPIRELE